MEFSIVTPCLNRVHTLDRMFRSVRVQALQNYEHIIVDGGSTDGSLERIRQEQGVELIVVPREGIYAAINRGIAKARGDIVVLLNTDDELCSGAFASVLNAFALDSSLDGVFSSVEFENDLSGLRTQIDNPGICALSARNCTSGNVLTNGKIFTRNALNRVGQFDPRWRMLSDRDFMLRAFGLGLKLTFIREPIYRYHRHIGSLTVSDVGRNRDIVREAIEISSLRYSEERGTSLEKWYRSWHAFARAYGIYDQCLEGEWFQAQRTLVQGLRADPLFLFGAAEELYFHWREAGLRRERPLATQETRTANARG
jgi:glycosyltransferase involved in cell wall biosynthesis